MATLAPSASAATIYWDGATSNWSTLSAWSTASGATTGMDKFTLPEGWTFTDLGENGPYVYATAIDATSGQSKVFSFLENQCIEWILVVHTLSSIFFQVRTGNTYALFRAIVFTNDDFSTCTDGSFILCNLISLW